MKAFIANISSVHQDQDDRNILRVWALTCPGFSVPDLILSILLLGPHPQAPVRALSSSTRHLDILDDALVNQPGLNRSAQCSSADEPLPIHQALHRGYMILMLKILQLNPLLPPTLYSFQATIETLPTFFCFTTCCYRYSRRNHWCPLYCTGLSSYSSYPSTSSIMRKLQSHRHSIAHFTHASGSFIICLLILLLASHQTTAALKCAVPHHFRSSFSKERFLDSRYHRQTLVLPLNLVVFGV
jgi:hypothetical protein